ncbi:hypothetical protein N7493_006077 [Penicillium malachiteum]|uniref:DUF3533 domain-containing protein n=1 Tax=Penicillium malachiteum TaxID=1324776 RepID=A0AAD6HJW2_9EURO|nr:hypothetical protein N7493_006077 [Penicillium malachiteum]
MVWNEARYSTVVDSAISQSLTELAEAARVAYMETGGKQLFQSLNTSDSSAISIFSDPWTLSSIDLQPTTQGSRLIYNTLVIILILIPRNSFSLEPSMVCTSSSNFTQQSHPTDRHCASDNVWDIHLHQRSLPRALSGHFDMAGRSMGTSSYSPGWFYGFRTPHFLTLDVFTIWLPPTPYVPMALISWVVLNVRIDSPTVQIIARVLPSRICTTSP